MKHVRFVKKGLYIIAIIFLINIVIVKQLVHLNLRYLTRMKYILLWTPMDTVPFVYMGNGSEGFLKRNCPHTNCFVTSKRNLLDDLSFFDVIVFAGPQLAGMSQDIMLPDPQNRLTNQKYVFTSIESADNYPLCSSKLDGYFNWTWSYKVNSDIRWGYIVIRDAENNIVGPKENMHWIATNDMKPTSVKVKKLLGTKTRAAAWFASNCVSRSNRENIVFRLQKELSVYNHQIDIYGDCGLYSCPRENKTKCDSLISKHYYFYLSFENSFSEDYVTEKLLTPLQNLAVPIVYGGANYSRFLPKGSYINARKLKINKLAATMNNLINDPEAYADYFRWMNHYSYHSTGDDVETNEYCKMCAMLNDDEKMKKTSVYENFRKWWNPSDVTC